MPKLEDYDIEKMYQEMLDESNQEGYAKMLKDSDPILYDVGLSEYENEIIYNLEQREVKKSAKQNWTQIDYVVYKNWEKLNNIFEEGVVPKQQKKKSMKIK